MLFSFGFGLRTIEEAVNIFLSHYIFFGGSCGLLLIFDGFVELSRAVLPQLVGVYGSEDMRNVCSKRCYMVCFFVLLPPT